LASASFAFAAVDGAAVTPFPRLFNFGIKRAFYKGATLYQNKGGIGQYCLFQ
jgi:hypothetical protein